MTITRIVVVAVVIILASGSAEVTRLAHFEVEQVPKQSMKIVPPSPGTREAVLPFISHGEASCAGTPHPWQSPRGLRGGSVTRNGVKPTPLMTSAEFTPLLLRQDELQLPLGDLTPRRFFHLIDFSDLESVLLKVMDCTDEV